MTDFFLFLKLGWSHFLDPGGLDHLLFIAALVVVYQWIDWKKLAWLVTAFTVGHSLTLTLTITGLIQFPETIVEMLIPTTILFTSLANLIKGVGKRNPASFQYTIAVGFGLIHGMGFANNLKSILIDPEEILAPLMGFNIGLELAQLLIVFIIVVLTALVVGILKVQHRYWNIAVSGACAGISLFLIFNNFN